MVQGGNRGERAGQRADREQRVEVLGVIAEALPNAMFRVECEGEPGVLASVSGSMRRFLVKVLPGDRVTVELSPYDPKRGRITYRHK